MLLYSYWHISSLVAIMRYLPIGYLPKIKWQGRYIRATDSDMEDTLNVQRKNDKVQLNKETYAKKYRGKLINTMYIPSHQDYYSNLEQVRNYCLYLYWVINYYLGDRELSQILAKFEQGTQGSWYVWLNEQIMTTRFTVKFAQFIRCAKIILLSPHLEFERNKMFKTHTKFFETVRLNMVDKENILRLE